jgi:hypothetical protein
MWLAMKLEHKKREKPINIIILIKKYTSNVLEPSLQIAITYWFFSTLKTTKKTNSNHQIQ